MLKGNAEVEVDVHLLKLLGRGATVQLSMYSTSFTLDVSLFAQEWGTEGPENTCSNSGSDLPVLWANNFGTFQSGEIEQNRVYTTSTKKKSYIFLCIVSVNRHESMAFLYVYMRHVSRETHGVRISLILKTCVQGSLSAFRTLRLLSSVSAWPAAFVSNSPAVGYPRAESYLV